MSQFKVKLTGVSPLLCNRFTDAAAEKATNGTRAAVRGAQPAPQEQARERLYLDGAGRPVLPGANLLRALVDAGQFIKAGKSKVSTARSSLVPAGVAVLEPELAITPTRWEVDARPVVIPATAGRILCYRPRFDQWAVGLTVDVDDELFDEATVRSLFDLAGKRVGVGDFRPARRGPFGRFRVDGWKRC